MAGSWRSRRPRYFSRNPPASGPGSSLSATDNGDPHGHRVPDESRRPTPTARSEEHTSELQSQSISYAVFCLKKKTEIVAVAICLDNSDQRDWQSTPIALR